MVSLIGALRGWQVRSLGCRLAYPRGYASPLGLWWREPGYVRFDSRNLPGVHAPPEAN